MTKPLVTCTIVMEDDRADPTNPAEVRTLPDYVATGHDREAAEAAAWALFDADWPEDERDMAIDSFVMDVVFN